jgi:tRNA-2-methylthio-N6-dimethylallyladenosine synthase
MAECEAVCEHLHFPLQSGSDAVLRRMKRAYSRRSYLDKVAMARATIEGLALTTDIIVGFPGETDEEFEDTMSLVEEVRYDSAYMFQYSKRPGTAAATMDDQVAKPDTQRRFDRLLQRQTDISLERNRELVGSAIQLTIEKPGTGRSRTNKLLHLDSDARPGSGIDAVVTDAKAHYLLGQPS